MNTEPHNDRIVNGLLKADIGLITPEEVHARLSRNVLIRVNSSRSGADDLWPCVWFLAAILEREVFGSVFIEAGLDSPLAAPAPLGRRCEFVGSDFVHEGLTIGLGVQVHDGIWGDARGNLIGFGTLAAGEQRANPISCCALAGYLGFAALAQAAGIPPYHSSWTLDQLELPLSTPLPPLPPQMAVLGTGQIGQAFLALAFFMPHTECPTIYLLDKDDFEAANYRSQLLLSEVIESWDGQSKVGVLSSICRDWGWNVTSEKVEIGWGWKSPCLPSAIAFLGFDNMDARRIGVEGGFARLVECGVGTDFLKPRISWHSLPPDREKAKTFFAAADTAQASTERNSSFIKELDETPGACGRVEFENIQATAPCLGALAAAYAFMELCNFNSGDLRNVSGSAYAWSPLLPLQREVQ